MDVLTNASHKIIGVLSGRRFFWLVVVLLVVQAVWIALTGRYPMAFDEDFHLGIIKIYAGHLTPFLASQPQNATTYGAVAQDPSYLFHYVFSFPYRFISLFTDNQTAQVLFLRGLNIACFALGLPLYRRLLLKTGASRALVHACLLIFVLTPVVPLLAAQINYDNVFLPLTALSLLLSVSISQGLSAHKRIRTDRLLQLLIVCLLTSLVKYAFLPIFLAISVYLLVGLFQTYKSWSTFWRNLRSGFVLINRATRWLLVVGLLVSIGLFLQRDGMNVVRYHTPVPDCEQVLSVNECQDYSPWARNYQLTALKNGTTSNPVSYSMDWLYGMWLRSFFAVDGPATNYETRGPLDMPAIAALAFPAIAALAFIVRGKRVFQHFDKRVLALFVTISVVYVAVLWVDGFQTYMQTGEPVAINGRYLFPILPMALLIGALSIREFLTGREVLKTSMLLVCVLCLVWGGGALTYILRSRDAWYWPSPIVRDVNGSVRRVLTPITPGSARPTEFLNWN